MEKWEDEIKNLQEAVEVLRERLNKDIEFSYCTDSTFDIHTKIGDHIYTVKGSLSICSSIINVMNYYTDSLENNNFGIRKIFKAEKELKEYIRLQELEEICWVSLSGDVLIQNDCYSINDFLGIKSLDTREVDMLLFEDFTAFIDYSDNCKITIKEYEVV